MIRLRITAAHRLARAVAAGGLVVLGCGREVQSAPQQASGSLDAAPRDEMEAKADLPVSPPPPPSAFAVVMDDSAPATLDLGARSKMVTAEKDRGFGNEVAKEAPGAVEPERAPAAPTRSWFPETFLFAPRVITDDKGDANLEVLVPDRLTTWRLLALAHSRTGMQAGTVTSLVGNLPVSVDVVVPPYLVAGDRVALPMQVVNTTDKALSRTLIASATGARLGALSGGGAVRVEGGGTATLTAWLDATAPGTAVVEARVGEDDAVRRTIPVSSGGEPRRVETSGTLASTRTFSLAPGADILPGSAVASLQVFPGALAILRAELAAAPERQSVDDDAYLLALTGRARPLAAALKAPLDDAQLVRLTRIATQRLARHALRPELWSAMRLAPGAVLHPADTLVGQNGEHLAAFIARLQRPDGTFAGEDGWPVQRLLVATADGVGALRADTATDAGKRRATAAGLRARGAFERFAGQIDDAFTAAAVINSGVLDGPLKEELQKRVAAALVQDGDGARRLPVPEGAVRASGVPPSSVEATAQALLALLDHPASTALLPDLGAAVLSAYRPGAGFGDGATNRVALEAVARIFDDPMPQRVVVSITVDGKERGSDVLEGARLQEMMRLDVPVEAVTQGKPLSVVVRADPPVPGLSYVMTLAFEAPWPAPPPDSGLSLDVTLPPLKVGVTAEVKVRATAPGGAPLVLVQGLPAGVDAVQASLEGLVQSGAIASYALRQGVVELVAPARNQGELFEVSYKVVPTLAGTLHGVVSSAQVQGRDDSRVHFPPATWTIAR